MISNLFSYLYNRPYLILVLIIILTSITLGLTLVPADFIGDQKIWSYDKLGHLLLFGAWTYLFGLYQLTSNSSSLHLFTIFLVGVGFGIAVEGLQHILPINRTADFFDVAFDSLGSFLAVLFLYITVPEQYQK